jgi:hypothetical protein
MISRVGEAGEPFEEDLELEEDVVLPIEREPVEPALTRLRVLATEPAGVAEKVRVRVVLERERCSAKQRLLIGQGHHVNEYQSRRGGSEPERTESSLLDGVRGGLRSANT